MELPLTGAIKPWSPSFYNRIFRPSPFSEGFAVQLNAERLPKASQPAVGLNHFDWLALPVLPCLALYANTVAGGSPPLPLLTKESIKELNCAWVGLSPV